MSEHRCGLRIWAATQFTWKLGTIGSFAFMATAVLGSLKNELVILTLNCRRASSIVSTVARCILVDIVPYTVKITLTKLQLFVMIHVVFYGVKLLTKGQITIRCVGVSDSGCRYNRWRLGTFLILPLARCYRVNAPSILDVWISTTRSPLLHRSSIFSSAVSCWKLIIALTCSCGIEDLTLILVCGTSWRLNHHFFVIRTSCWWLHRIHSLTPRTHITVAKLRLVIHTIRSNLTGCSTVVKLFSTAFEVLTDMKWGSTDSSATSIKTLSILSRIRAYLIMWICYHSRCLDSMCWLFGRCKSFLSLMMIIPSCTIGWLAHTCIDRLHLLASWWWHGLHRVSVIRAGYSVAVHNSSVATFPKSLLQTTSLATRTMASTACRYWNCLRVYRLLDKASFVFRLFIITTVRVSSWVYHVVRWVVRVELLNSDLRWGEPLSVASCHFLCRVANSQTAFRAYIRRTEGVFGVLRNFASNTFLWSKISRILLIWRQMLV